MKLNKSLIGILAAFQIMSTTVFAASDEKTQDEVQPDAPKLEWYQKEKSGPEELKKYRESMVYATKSLKDVKQGEIGDCYLLAACANIAHKHPEKIEEIVKVFDDHVEVHFYKPFYAENWEVKFEDVTVSLPLELNGTPTCAPWVQYIEMAWAKSKISSSLSVWNRNEDGLKNLEGNSQEIAYMVLLGEMCTAVIVDMQQEDMANSQLWNFFKKTIKDKKCLGLTFLDSEKSKYGGIYKKHCYAIVGYSEEENELFVKISNPHDAKNLIYMETKNFFECKPCVTAESKVAYELYKLNTLEQQQQ